MCGIFGLHIQDSVQLQASELRNLVDNLFMLSESRGKEAAGIAIRSGNDISVFKKAQPATEMIAGAEYKKFFETAIKAGGPLTLIGHARLVTNGLQNMDDNNQPIVKNGLVGVHNGIITNDKELWEMCPDQKRETEVDTEAFLALLSSRALNSNGSYYNELASAFDEIEGNASILMFSESDQSLVGATNNGSLYLGFLDNTDIIILASEKYILSSVYNDKDSHSIKNIEQVEPNKSIIIESTNDVFKWEKCSLGSQKVKCNIVKTSKHNIYDYSKLDEELRREMRRCTKCILPETMPFIEFDDEGVCNYCRTYERMDVSGKDKALDYISKFKKNNDGADCLLMLSGGRDSCYGLHYAVEELGLRPIAYTYDWGMVTDIARRNAARMCGKLGVEHIIVSADINKKRANIKKNIEAWLKKPTLGMVPLFMAGDKQYFYYAQKIKEINNLPYSIVSENPLEYTKFKAGYCGINEADKRIFNISLAKKIKLGGYYTKELLMNPAYINSTLVDSLFAFWSSYLMPHDHLFLFDYVRWEESPLVDTLIRHYGWETDPNCESTWRIGDGTAAFYNYIYYTVSGFTENDTLRSNQIREGDLTRDEALAFIKIENQPRWQSLEWYASVVGFNLLNALQVINNMPRLYMK